MAQYLSIAHYIARYKRNSKNSETVIFVQVKDVKLRTPRKNFAPPGVPSWLRACSKLIGRERLNTTLIYLTKSITKYIQLLSMRTVNIPSITLFLGSITFLHPIREAGDLATFKRLLKTEYYRKAYGE